MLEKEVFRIRNEAAEAEKVRMTEEEELHYAVSSSPTAPTTNRLPESGSSSIVNTSPLSQAMSAAVPVSHTMPSQHAPQELQMSPRTSAGGSSQHHVLVTRAAASFRHDRRLQRGQIDLRNDGRGGSSSVSPTWKGLPDSLLHAAKSESCLPLPSSENGISDTVEQLTAAEPVATADVTLSPHAENVLPLPLSDARRSTSARHCPSMPLVAEDDEGDVEYKWRLTGISATRFQHLVTQMQFRVSEGRGQCLYELGVSDDGTPRGLTRRDFDESVQTIQRMAAQLQLETTLLQCCAVSTAEAEPAGTPRSQKKGSLQSTRSTARRSKQWSSSGGASRAAEETGELFCGEIMVSRRQSSSVHDLSVAFCGAVGCGKSTLMAVLLTARLDDGRGGTRQSLFNHKHELDSGRTSSLAARVWMVPQDSADAGSPTGHGAVSLSPPPLPEALPVPNRFQPSWSPVSSPAESAAPPTPPFTCASPRSITLLDAGGDITKTMLFGFMSRKPDYVCVCVAADTSDVSDVSLFAEVCCAMNTPFVVVVTKVDCVEEFELDGLMMELTIALEQVGCVAEQVETMQTAAAYCREWLPRHRDAAVDGGTTVARFGSPTSAHTPLPVERLRVAVFCVSSVEGGEGLDLLRSCLSHLQNPPPSPPLSPPSCVSKPPFEVLLDCAFHVDDVGPVVHGRVAHGLVEVGCTCYVGPGSDGRFYTVLVRGIHVDGEHVNMAQVGDEATFALDRLPKAVTVAQKGKVLVRQPERVTMAFEAVVQVLSQSISAHMEPIMYTRNARQAVHVAEVSVTPSAAAEMASDAVALHDVQRECMVRCRFLFRPEVVGPGDAVVLHWAPRGIAVGRITSAEHADNSQLC